MRSRLMKSFRFHVLISSELKIVGEKWNRHFIQMQCEKCSYLLMPEQKNTWFALSDNNSEKN